MLCRVGILVNLLSNHLAQACLLGKPFPCKASDRVPANLDWSRSPIDHRLRDRHRIGLAAQANGVLQSGFSLVQIFLAEGVPTYQPL